MGILSENLKALRTEKGWTQQEMADRLFVTRQAVSNWENGKTEPDIETLKNIADILQTPVDKLLYNSGTASPAKKKACDKGTVFCIIIFCVCAFFRYFSPYIMDMWFRHPYTFLYYVYEKTEFLWMPMYSLSLGTLEFIAAVLVIRLKYAGMIKRRKYGFFVETIHIFLVLIISLHAVNAFIAYFRSFTELDIQGLFEAVILPIRPVIVRLWHLSLFKEKRAVFIIMGALCELLKSDKTREKAVE